MTMRKHKNQRNFARLPQGDHAQLRTTMMWHGLLLGAGKTMVENIFSKIKRATAQPVSGDDARLKVLRRLYHASGGKPEFDIPKEDMTPLDKSRILRARARRHRQNTTRAKHA